jgi:hypothetical protein
MRHGEFTMSTLTKTIHQRVANDLADTLIGEVLDWVRPAELPIHTGYRFIPEEWEDFSHRAHDGYMVISYAVGMQRVLMHVSSATQKLIKATITGDSGNGLFSVLSYQRYEQLNAERVYHAQNLNADDICKTKVLIVRTGDTITRYERKLAGYYLEQYAPCGSEMLSCPLLSSRGTTEVPV